MALFIFLKSENGITFYKCNVFEGENNS